VLIVSHDRDFLNNVVTSTIAFIDSGHLEEYVGGYDDYVRQRPAQISESVQPPKKETAKKDSRPKEKTKLSFKETRELNELPQKIEALENEKREITGKLNDSAFQTKSDAKTINDAIARLEAIESELDQSYHRWNELEELSARLSG
jgi:ATP-binding cassette subfamily F protein uup